MAHTLAQANLCPAEMQMVNCHATSTKVGDIAELHAIQRLFSSTLTASEFKEAVLSHEYTKIPSTLGSLPNLAVSAYKSQLGHLISAAGAVESIIAIKSLKNNWISPQLNLSQPEADFVDFTRKGKFEMKNILKNSFAFGGVNSSVLFSKI